ncbi:MAG: hypothetical protein PHN72_02030 [Bacilli bacterium]|nr:hypothetical protein [Bacilli bacterium]
MKNLYIDFDGVIMDTITSSYQMMQEIGIDGKDYSKVVNFYKNLDWKEFLEEADEIHDAYKEINCIVDSGYFNVNILTHVTSLGEAEAKINFIRKKLHEITIITVPKSIDKTKMVNAKNAILIDDYSGNLKKWIEAGGIGVKFALKEKGKEYPVIDHLEQIIDFVNEVNEVNV